MWLVEDMGVKEYAAAVKAEVESSIAVLRSKRRSPTSEGAERRELLGVHAQADDTRAKAGRRARAGGTVVRRGGEGTSPISPIGIPRARCA